MKRKFQNLGLAISFFSVMLAISCKDEETKPTQDVISGFTFEVDANDFKTVNFTNASSNFSKVEWDFGDGSAVSTEESPSHTYTETGTFTVTLTATSIDGTETDESDQEVTISDPNEQLTALAGDDSKTWKLIRDVSTGRYPLEVGPWDRSTIWWAVGRDNDELAIRSCLLNDEWTFSRSGAMVFDAKGDYWGEGGTVATELENACQPTDNMVGPAGEDLSAWGGGNHTFTLTTGSPSTLKVDGLGAFVGFFKLGNLVETKVPLSSVTYNVVKLTDGDVDTLIVEGQYKWDDSDGGYWRFVLVHYDNPADEPAIPGNKPNVSFTLDQTGNTINTVNSTEFGGTYLWDFGDGTTSTEENPSHTYAADGIYNVTLTSSNSSGTTVSRAQMVIANATTPALTDALLQGAAWRVQAEDMSLFVGPGLGKSDWYVVPKSDLAAGGSWDCLSNDEFTFSSGGVFGYNTNGDVRNDGYMAGFENGCISDEDLATVTNDGKLFKSEANHAYTFVEATGGANAILTVSNGAATDAVAFLGFYKPFYGGENNNQANAAHGGATSVQYEVLAYAKNTSKEYLFVTVDISGAKDGSASWSFVMIR